MAGTRTKDPTAGRSSDEPRRKSYLRPAILVLLKENESHGYELVARLGDMGFEVGDFGGLYRVLRTMDEEGLVVSVWGEPERGPARRVYRLTDEGEQYLRESAPALVSQRRALGEMLDRYRTMVRDERRPRRRGRNVLVVED
ncbi:MAG: helix-turn-helix transcriptional regulator, partial [Acidimicrobiales bacterium]